MRRKFKIPTVNIAATAYTIMDDADKNFKHAKLYVNPNPVKDSVDYHCDVTNYIIVLEYEDEKHEEVAKLLNSLTQIYEKEGYKLEDYEIKNSDGYDWRKLLKEAEPKEETTTKYNLWYSKPVDTNTFSPGISVDSILPEKDYDLRVLQEVSIRLDLLKKLIDKLTPIYEEEGCLADLKEEVAGIVQELSSIIEG